MDSTRKPVGLPNVFAALLRERDADRESRVVRREAPDPDLNHVSRSRQLADAGAESRRSMLAPAIASLGPRRRRPHGSTLSRTVALGSAVPWDIRGSKEPHPLGVSGQRRLSNAASLGASRDGVDSARRVPWRAQVSVDSARRVPWRVSGQRRLSAPRPLACLRTASTRHAASLGASQDSVDSARRVPWRVSGLASIRPSSERSFAISAPTQVICATDSRGPRRQFRRRANVFAFLLRRLGADPRP